VTHPDAPDLRLESFTRMLFGKEEKHRALSDALDTARVVSAAGEGARDGEPRFTTARTALERFDPDSPWLTLLGKEPPLAPAARTPYIAIGDSVEAPVPFDEQAIAAALSDEARGRRHFPGYRARETQVELARRVGRDRGRQIPRLPRRCGSFRDPARAGWGTPAPGDLDPYEIVAGSAP
jgi:hypothetical protein